MGFWTVLAIIVGVLLGAAGLGALFIYALNGIAFLIILVVLNML